MHTIPFAAKTLPESHLGVQLQCPRCRSKMQGLKCSQCSVHMEMRNSIVHALPPARAAYYARFIADYEHIRTEEGRGSQSEEFYLSLPYKDISGRNSSQWKIRSKSYDYLTRHVLQPLHHRGSVLDLDAGNCWMSFRLALLAEVDSWHEPEPSRHTAARVADLWRKVDQLEPISRDADAFTFPETIEAFAPPVIVPVEQLVPLRKA